MDFSSKSGFTDVHTNIGKGMKEKSLSFSKFMKLNSTQNKYVSYKRFNSYNFSSVHVVVQGSNLVLWGMYSYQ